MLLLLLFGLARAGTDSSSYDSTSGAVVPGRSSDVRPLERPTFGTIYKHAALGGLAGGAIGWAMGWAGQVGGERSDANYSAAISAIPGVLLGSVFGAMTADTVQERNGLFLLDGLGATLGGTLGAYVMLVADVKLRRPSGRGWTDYWFIMPGCELGASLGSALSQYYITRSSYAPRPYVGLLPGQGMKLSLVWSLP
jgi:hypothetical protein